MIIFEHIPLLKNNISFNLVDIKLAMKMHLLI